MQCPDCGTWFADDQPFCRNCGQVLGDGRHQARVGNYRLIERIGEGGMGIVYRGIDENLEREVAIKVLHQHLLSDAKQVERFRREARMHGQLMHPNIITLLDVINEPGLIALVMELLRGCTLKEYLKDRGIPPWSEFVWIGQEILAALEAAHSQGVVHRDLKLSNVFLTDDGGLKLMDFGLAKPSKADDDITDSGATVGTYFYMAPEQILGSEIDARTDLYALGVMFYRMATGVLPFTSSGGGEFEVMEKQVRQTPVRPENINPDIPEKLSGLIMQMLEKIPDRRPSSAAEVRARLAEIATPRAPRPKDGRFSDIHARLARRRRKPGETSTPTDSEGAPESEQELHRDTLLWTFRHSSTPAPETPPLDLRSPPALSRDNLERLKKAIATIPPLPEPWQRIERVLDDPESAPSDLAREIEPYPHLAEHVRALASSGSRRLPGASGNSLAIAIASIGMDHIHDHLLAAMLPDFSGLKRLGSGNLVPVEDEARAVVAHGLLIARIFRRLADYANIVAAKAAGSFGLLHDIGKLVILHLEDDETLQSLRKAIAEGAPSLAAEWKHLGYTHIDAGMMLALHWKLPRSIHRFIYFHHHPAWHPPDVWPVDMQPAVMLNQMAHLVLSRLCDELPALKPLTVGIWSANRRSVVPSSESLLRHPLRLPLKDVAHYRQIRQEIEETARRTLPLLGATADTAAAAS